MKYTKIISNKYSTNRTKYRSTNKYTLPVVKKINLKEKIVLDFGCGDGSDIEMFIKMKAKEIIGVDSSASMIALAKQKYKGSKEVKFTQTKGMKLSFKNSQFDFVFSHFVLHYIKDIKKQFREIARVMNQGAIFVAVFNCLTHDKKLVNKKVPLQLGKGRNEIIITIFSKSSDEIKKDLSTAGLEIIKFSKISNPDAKIDLAYSNKYKFKEETILFLVRKK